MEERRLLIALALSVLLISVWPYIFGSPPKATPGPTVSSSPSGGASPSPPSATPAPSETPSARPPAEAATLTPIADERERRVEFEADTATLAFSNRGARLLSWRLKHHKDARGQGEEMVPGQRNGTLPLDLETGDKDVDARLQRALFKPSAELVRVDDPEPELRFQWAEGSLEVEKTLRPEGRRGLVWVTASVRQGGRPLPVKVLWGPGLGNPTAAEKGVQGYAAPHAVVLTQTGVERLRPADITAPRRMGGVRWMGIESHYFTSLFVPAGSQNGAGEIRTEAIPGEEGKEEKAVLVAFDLDASGKALLYVGAKDYHELKAVGYRLHDVVPVGDWIGPIVVPLLSLLRWVHGHVGNYGWSIVVLTIFINLVMAPFRHYSIANGLKMAKVGPEIRTIQERYRKVPLLERQGMNEEIAKVYAKHGMSMGTQMAVGCLPTLLTLPFLYAFYNVLQLSIDLKGASFLWIPDLSQKDPLFITPLLMGASMLIMQRLTPTPTMDPAQQKILMLMPIMFTVMFFAAPAGLNLYWLASNLCSITQQSVTLRLLRDREAGAARDKKRR
jgi:YidC/Oxa1 family membrane protein insertase